MGRISRFQRDEASSSLAGGTMAFTEAELKHIENFKQLKVTVKEVPTYILFTTQEDRTKANLVPMNGTALLPDIMHLIYEKFKKPDFLMFFSDAYMKSMAIDGDLPSEEEVQDQIPRGTLQKLHQSGDQSVKEALIFYLFNKDGESYFQCFPYHYDGETLVWDDDDEGYMEKMNEGIKGFIHETIYPYFRIPSNITLV